MTTRRRILLGIVFVLFIVNVVVFWNRYKYQNELVLISPPVVSIPSSSPKESFHNNKNPEAWIQYIEEGLVQVQMVDSKTVIIFRPQKEHVKLFEEKKGYITPVTFKCDKKIEDECDLSQPYRLYVNNLSVELVKVIKRPS